MATNAFPAQVVSALFFRVDAFFLYTFCCIIYDMMPTGLGAVQFTAC
jgi:hypothetical protein